MIENNVFITGASGGLGLELAKVFVENNFRVFGTGTNIDKIESAKKSLGSSKFNLFQCDNRDEKTTLKILNLTPKLDIYVNNAGIYLEGLPVDNTCERIQSVINTNLIGSIITTRIVLSKMQSQEGGIIVDINSNVSLISKQKRSVYTAAKKGFDAFMECIQLDYPKIKFVSIYPAGMKTELHSSSGNPRSDYHKFLDPKLVSHEIVKNLLLGESFIQTKQYFERDRI